MIMASSTVPSPVTAQDHLVQQARALYLKAHPQPQRGKTSRIARMKRSYRRAVRQFQVWSTWALWTIIIGYVIFH